MKVSVLMASFNSDVELLSEVIKSVIIQTYTDFEFLIIDDGSKMPVEPIVKKISSDKRIIVYRKENSGLGSSLTYGIEKSRGEYIARIDDDDLMVQDRLEKQVAYLDSHPDVSCVGSNMFFYCKNKYVPYRRFPIDHDGIVRSMLSRKWAMAHSALMYRRECVNKSGGYRLKGTGEDLDLILQLSLVGKLANIDEYLIYYHIGLGSLSAINSQLPGHAFALNEYKKSMDYIKYSNIVEDSLAAIESEINAKKKRINWKRLGIIMYIRLFGKRIPTQGR